ncbi:capsular polysaccharide biosynthesis protein [Burkholderia cepacia]|uniref:capsular polysaccharide biosynthesis protein n=1 Tax=Burkholderia cepacia TaxID=292 RepID=UPI0011B67201|nr:capsular biosynthesis protein [Burkholderia cepacia]MDN7633682.1 capsular biosynthesis protein [Burkholderia cepacia]MDN7891598.1 capsular biosynthesis protein [Burkholderia cepacia]
MIRFSQHDSSPDENTIRSAGDIRASPPKTNCEPEASSRSDVRRVDERVNITWPGPFQSQSSRGTPRLSWFSAQFRKSDRHLFADALNETLQGINECDTRSAWLLGRVAALCTCPLPPLPSAATHQPSERVLIIDERITSTQGAKSPRRNDPEVFRRMVATARANHRGADIRILRSKDRAHGKWLSAIIDSPLPVMDASTLPFPMLPEVDHIYALGAIEGLFGLLAGASVHVYAEPFYAGWGLTQDEGTFPERRARPTLVEFFEAIFLHHCGYLDPVTHAPGRFEQLLTHLELQRAVRSRFAELACLAGFRFQWWKRPFATPFLVAGGGVLRWTTVPDIHDATEYAVLWGARNAGELSPASRHVRIEDGFIHSDGLGSDMSPPASQVIDKRGIYFDASRPSDLSELLNTAEFSEEELVRAKSLRANIVSTGISKYNLGRRRPSWTPPSSTTVVLVPGQVADDASIKLGTGHIRDAEALLHAVRHARPSAFIVYKPHPDVLSGNRKGLVHAAQLADIVDTDSDLLSLIDVADEVHTMSSLAGFDALLREKAVFTYGMPFYAGWGLTQDHLPIPWRHRTLTLDMLVAGAFVRYPIYWDWKLRLYTTPEAAIHRLSAPAARPLSDIGRNWSRPIRKILRWIRNASSHFAWRIRMNRQSGFRYSIDAALSAAIVDSTGQREQRHS